MLVYISQMVQYFSLFDTFMDQTQDSSIIAAADTSPARPNIEQNWILYHQNYAMITPFHRQQLFRYSFWENMKFWSKNL